MSVWSLKESIAKPYTSNDLTHLGTDTVEDSPDYMSAPILPWLSGRTQVCTLGRGDASDLFDTLTDEWSTTFGSRKCPKEDGK
jgi:hypothetical protein